MGNKNVKNFIVLLTVALVIVACFAYLSNRTKSAEEGSQTLTAVQEVLTRDLSTNYPPTPKEVLKYYSEITRCFYSEEYSDEELAELADQALKLLDDELKANQSETDYMEKLKSDIASYKEEGRTISSYSVASSANVKYYDYEGSQWAMLNCVYSLKEKGTISPTKEEFLLRKDESGRWKIFGWRIIEDEDDTDAEE